VRVHTILNLFRPDAVQAAREHLGGLVSKGITLGADHESAEVLGVEAVAPENLGRADLMISFGGDGTLIRAAHVCAEHGTPILGVYYGRFGFVTQCMPDEIGAVISQFLDGGLPIEERLMVQTELIRDEKTVATLHSLNETVVQRSATTRVLTFDVRVDGARLARYPADGMMVATPTGSTAYNLSAGGPIVDPKMRALMLTAIMPHTLNARPLVLTADSQIEIRVQTRGDAVLSCDGQSRLHLLSGDLVKVTTSPRVTRLVTVDDQDFMHKLAHRFQWSQGARQQ